MKFNSTLRFDVFGEDVNTITAQKRTRVVPLIVASVLTFSVGIGLTTIWLLNKTHGDKRQSSEPPIQFEPTSENKGKRCEAWNYVGVPGNEHYDNVCYQLQTKLTKAAIDGNLTELRDALRYGANPNASVENYDPPLILAASEGHLEVVHLLLDNGADVNKGTFIRGTPLIVSAANGQAEIAKLLLERGADACFKADGGTAEDFAQKRGHYEIVKLVNMAKPEGCK